LVNTTVLNAWWNILTVLYGIVTLYGVAKSLPVFAKEKWSPSGIFNNRVSRNLFFLISLCMLKFSEGMLRMTLKKYPGQPGSAAWPVTIVSFLGGSLAWATVFPSILEQILTVMVKSSSIGGPEGKKVADKMEQMHEIMKKQPPIAIAAFAMIICTKFTEDPFVQRWFVVSYFIGCSIISVFFVFFVGMPAASAFEQTIRESLDSASTPKMKALHDKIKLFQGELRKNGYSNTGTAIIFGVCPFLWSVAPYQNAFGWSLGIPMFAFGIHFLAPTKGRATAKVAGHVPTTTSSTSESSN